MKADIFTEDFKTTPYWWDHVPRPSIPEAPLPPKADVVVVGSGYTGLHAALQTARGGSHTVVIDAEDAGWGCSTRNGGQISTSVKPGYAELCRRHDAEKAARILTDGRNSLAFIEDFVRTEEIDCAFGVVGRFHAAHNAAQYEVLARSVPRRGQQRSTFTGAGISLSGGKRPREPPGAQSHHHGRSRYLLGLPGG